MPVLKLYVCDSGLRKNLLKVKKLRRDFGTTKSGVQGLLRKRGLDRPVPNTHPDFQPRALKKGYTLESRGDPKYRPLKLD